MLQQRARVSFQHYQ